VVSVSEEGKMGGTAAGTSNSARVCQSARGTIWNGKRETALDASEQQLRSKRACSLHSELGKDWDCSECFFSTGQQLWREGEGSGLGAGGDPACATTAARDWRPEHAMTRWLTDQASSATIRTTPVDRLLAITRQSLRLPGARFCDWSHMGKLSAKRSGDAAIAGKIAFLLASLLFPLLAQATTPKNKASQAVQRGCGSGVVLKISAGVAAQGSLLLAEVRGLVDAQKVKAEWDGRPVPLWQETQQSARVLHGMIGVDLEKAPGSYDWKISWTAADGSPATCGVPITVRSGKFATEKLTVEKQYVQPDSEQQKRAEEDQKKMRAIFDTVTPEVLWNGKFRLPLKGDVAGRNFGRRRVLNGEARSPHTGIDFPAAAGTPVYAAQAGKVALAENLYYSGNTVVLDHGFGIYTLYAHLSEIGVRAGATVAASAEIGKVGATGRVTGPHLHWGLTIDHARVNGLQIVQKQP